MPPVLALLCSHSTYSKPLSVDSTNALSTHSASVFCQDAFQGILRSRAEKRGAQHGKCAENQSAAMFACQMPQVQRGHTANADPNSWCQLPATAPKPQESGEWLGVLEPDCFIDARRFGVFMGAKQPETGQIPKSKQSRDVVLWHLQDPRFNTHVEPDSNSVQGLMSEPETGHDS